MYETIKQITPRAHGDMYLYHDGTYGFCKSVRAMPVLISEFVKAAHEYVIIFAPSDEGKFLPALLLGAKEEHNLYVDEQGRWIGKYLPAFARRYPFVFSHDVNKQTYTLCIDEAYPGLNRDGTGESFFNDKDERTPYLEKILDFMKTYQGHQKQTDTFGRMLTDLDLLEDIHMRVPDGEGGQHVLTGMKSVSRDRLKAMAPDLLADLQKKDYLEMIYLHLFSMRNVNDLARRVERYQSERKAAS